MKYPMLICMSKMGIGVTYTCAHLPGHGKKCPDKNTEKCYKCKYSRAEMKGEDATRLLNSYCNKNRP